MIGTKRKTLFILLFVFIGFLIFGGAILAGDYDWPERPITLINPASEGGGFNRMLDSHAPFLEEELGVSVVIETHSGGHYSIGSSIIFEAEPDGYTGGAIAIPHVEISILRADTPYSSTIDDFAIAAGVNADPHILAVQEDSDINSMQDLVEKAEEKPLIIGTSDGVGDLAVRAMISILDLEDRVRVVLYDGGGEGYPALIGGHIDAYCGGQSGAYPLKDDIKAPIVMWHEESETFPEAKPWQNYGDEVGVQLPNFASIRTIGFNQRFKDKYPDRFNKFQEALRNVYENEKYHELVDDLGLGGVVTWLEPEEAEVMLEDYQYWVQEVYGE